MPSGPRYGIQEEMEPLTEQGKLLWEKGLPGDATPEPFGHNGRLA